MVEIFLYGPLFSDEVRDFGVTSGVTASEIVGQINEIPVSEEILMRINSGGGDADVGFAIQTALRRHEAKTTAIVDGMSASASTLAMFGADEVEMASNAGMMVHEAQVGVFGLMDERRIQGFLGGIQNYNKRIAQTYAERTKQTVEEWENILAEKDLFLTAKEALEAGFVNRIVGKVEVKMNVTKAQVEQAPHWLKQRAMEFQAYRRPFAKHEEEVANEVQNLLKRVSDIPS